jgi:hypothetical protein
MYFQGDSFSDGCGTLAPVIHTQWHSYHHKKFVDGTAAAPSDAKLRQLAERRAKEGSVWKLWKTLCMLLGVVLAAAAFFVGKMH